MSLLKVIKSACLFCAVALAAPTVADAQLITNNEYNREFSFGLMMHPRGVGIDLRFGRYNPGGRVEYIEADFLTLRHPKEIRIFNTGITNTNPYTYGKLNYAYLARLGYGTKFILSEKKLKNTASISFNISAGPILTALKPVYLDLLLVDVNNNRFVETKKVTPEASINQNDVIGNSPFSKGFNEINFKMGGYVKAGFNFDWGDFSDEIKAIEVGVFMDAFPQRLPLMLHTQNKYVFPSFYICAVFGNKW